MVGVNVDPARAAPEAPFAIPAIDTTGPFGTAAHGFVSFERTRRGRSHPVPPPPPGVPYSAHEKADFPIVTVPPTDNVGLFVKYSNGVVNRVPDAWVTEEAGGAVYVRGKPGYVYATNNEITAWFVAQGLEEPVFPGA